MSHGPMSKTFVRLLKADLLFWGVTCISAVQSLSTRGAILVHRTGPEA